MVGCIGLHLDRSRGTCDPCSRSVAVLFLDCKILHKALWRRILSVALAICHLWDLNAFCRISFSPTNISRRKYRARIRRSVQHHRTAYMVFPECPALRACVILNSPFVFTLPSFLTVPSDV